VLILFIEISELNKSQIRLISHKILHNVNRKERHKFSAIIATKKIMFVTCQRGEENQEFT
jgi:hypothetical protein